MSRDSDDVVGKTTISFDTFTFDFCAMPFRRRRDSISRVSAVVYTDGGIRALRDYAISNASFHEYENR